MEKLYKLPRAITEKWLEALESDQYDQGSGSLSECIAGRTRHCCLGVLGNVCGIDDKTMDGISFIQDSTQIHDGAYLREKRTELYNKAVEVNYPRELLYEPYLPEENKCLAGKLGSLNDDGNSFRYIAHWIRENVELYDEPKQIENQISFEL